MISNLFETRPPSPPQKPKMQGCTEQQHYYVSVDLFNFRLSPTLFSLHLLVSHAVVLSPLVL